MMCANESNEKDINDVFTDLLLCEERLTEEGYHEGFIKGSTEDNTEAFHLGYHRGAEIGSELGYYYGIIETLLQESSSNDPNSRFTKNKKHIENIKQLIETVPKYNSEDVDILLLVNNIRTSFKKLCALLKCDLSYPETDKLSF